MRLHFSLLVVPLLLAGSAHAGVRINELSAAANAREVQSWSNGLRRVGIEAPWHAPSFDAAAWPSAQGPFGFGAGVGTNVKTQMQNKAVSLYLRMSFAVDPALATSTNEVQLQCDWDDGFAAYLNGQELVRKTLYAPKSFVYFDQVAATNHSLGAQTVFTVGVASNLLSSGTNIFAVQIHNEAIDSADFGFVGALLAVGTNSVTLVSSNAVARYFIGLREPSGGLTDGDPPAYAGPNGLEWTQPSFTDVGWTVGPGPVGFGESYLATDVGSGMIDFSPTLYLRQPFVVTPGEAADTNQLEFVAGFDDGYIAFLNGIEVARSNMGARGEFKDNDATASAAREGNIIVTNRIGGANGLLVVGTNILAIQVHNFDVADTDLVMNASVNLIGPAARALAQNTNQWKYFFGEQSPSPPPDPDSLIAESEFSDWVELFNDGTGAVSLAGWSLTDEADQPGKWKFPTNASIAAGGYYVVLCNGAPTTNQSVNYPSASFVLSAGGEYLGVFDAASQLVSQIAAGYPHQSPFHTYGVASGPTNFMYFDLATPGASNQGQQFVGYLPEPGFTNKAGIQSGSFVLLNFTSAVPGVTMRYTKDGTEPTASNGFSGNAIITAPTALRVRSILSNWIPSPVVSRSMLLGVPDALKTNRIVSLIGDWEQTFHKSNGVFSIVGGTWTNALWVKLTDDDFNLPSKRGRAFERPLQVEFINPNSGTVYRIKAGLRAVGSNHARPRYVLQNMTSTGNWYGSWEVNKPQMNLFFRQDYEGDAEFDFVSGSRVDEFEGIRLRAGKNDWDRPFVRDEIARRLLAETGQPSARGQMVSLFVNGIFRCYYNPCERLDEKFFQEWYRSTNDWDIINHGGVANGDNVAYNALQSAASARNCSILTNYQFIASKLDVVNFTDYLMVNTYTATWDWPHNNFYTASERGSNSLFRYFTWDAEGAFSNNGGKTNGYDVVGVDLINKTTFGIGVLFNSVYKSPEFRLLWADRFFKHVVHPGGCLDSNAVLARAVEVKNEVNPMVRYVRNADVDLSIITNWVKVRRDFMFIHFDKWGLLPPNTPPQFSQWGGAVTNGTQVALSHTNGAGQIYYALDGADPRAPGGAIAGTLYTAPITIDRSRVVKARVFDGGTNWSAASEATFISDAPPLVVTEIMYNPAGTNAAEFIELYNAGTNSIDLSLYQFTGGIVFDFASAGILAPGQYVLVVQNLAAFSAAYSTNGLKIAGTYSGSLNNGGENIELTHDNFGLMDSFTYSDGWYPRTDGDGFSLTLRNPNTLHSLFSQETTWRASSHVGGSPGYADPNDIPLPGSIVINELLAHTDASPVGDWIELHNTTPAPVHLGGWYLSDSAANVYKYLIPTGTWIEAGAFLVFNATNHFNAPSAPQPFALSEFGDSAILVSGYDTNGLPTSYYEDQHFDASEKEITLGRHLRTDGQDDFVPLRAPTPGTNNAYPLIGPIIATEILYQPATNRAEFVQFYNASTQTVALYDTEAPARRWRLADAVAYTFPTGITVAPFTTFIVTGTNPAAFRTQNPTATNIPVFGPWTGALNNAGDKISLVKMLPLDGTNAPDATTEYVDYNDIPLWPLLPTNTWPIERKRHDLWSSEPTNWKLGTPNGTPGPMLSTDGDADGIPDAWETAHALNHANPTDAQLDTDTDGMTALEEFIAGTDPNNPADTFRVSMDLSPTGTVGVLFLARNPTNAGYENFKRTYALDSTTNAIEPWMVLPPWTNIPGTGQWQRIESPGDALLNFRARVWLQPK